MRAYLLRITPKDTDRVAEALASDTLIIGWSDIPECLDETVTRDEVTRLIHERRYPNDTNLRRAGSAAGNLWRFVREMDIGDLVVVPHGDDIYFATVESAPFYLAEFVDQRMAYRRHAHWLNKDRPVARHSLPESLQKEARRQKTCSDTHVVPADG